MKQSMKTNKIMDEIRRTISPEMKLQMEMSVAIEADADKVADQKGNRS